MTKKPDQKKKVQERIALQLYVSGMSEKSMVAIENIQRLCDQYPDKGIELEIVDIYKNPRAAAESHIVFSPSLVKLFPPPKKILIGTLADTEKVLKALGIIVKS
jgi:circadian clock protein KaiB